MQGCRFATSHVLRVYIHRIDKSLYSGNVSVSTGLEQLPERPTDAAAAVAGAGRSGAGAGAGATAAGGCRGGARTAR